MPLQDLTPELRTRLSRVERTVGWFVSLATLILVAGFIYYIYSTAQRRGWFVTKINYATSLSDASGLHAGDAVTLKGFTIGEITRVELNTPDSARGVTVFFSVRAPYYGYIWYDSQVRIDSDLLKPPYLEVLKGQNGAASVYTDPTTKDLLVMNRFRAWEEYKRMTNQVMSDPANKGVASFELLSKVTNDLMHAIRTETSVYYTNAVRAKFTSDVDSKLTGDSRNYYFIPLFDSPSLADRLNAVASSVETALPNIFNLTNQLASILSNANNAVIRLNTTLADAHPIVTNLAIVTGNLRDPNGSLGNWIIPTNLNVQLRETLENAIATLKSAHATLDSTDTNVTMLATDLDHTLEHLSDLTSNLSWQVQMNTNLITEISTTIVHTDGLIQGLKRHWLLRSAFKKKPVKDSKHPTNQSAPDLEPNGK